jgi:GTPase Era involved in 16S rRNA processing
LLEYVENHPSIRFAAIKLVIPEHSIRELNDYDDKQLKIYRKALDDTRRKRKKILDKLDQFDRLLAYRKSEIRMSNHLVASYADRLMRQQQSEFIGKSIMEPKMNTATNLDEVRQQAIAQLEALQKYLNEKGRTKEAEDISKEVTKLRDNTYQIAFVATFSAGKSTLINAMLGNDILPSMAKPTTGRLTFINDREGDVAAQIEVSKKGNQRVIILSYRDPQDLQKHLYKYLRNGSIGKAEVYSKDKSLQFDGSVDLVDSPFYPVNEADDIHANQARLNLNRGYSSFSLTDVSQVELGSFINNDAVKELNIYAPVKHLTKQVRLNGIQFVDTPGTNSARHANHKRITFDFINKANAVVYVINFTTAFTDDDALLLEEIRQQREYNPQFCNKLFFAVNKIDQDNSNGQNLQDTLSSIYNTLTNDYGFDIEPDRVIGIAAFPALLYRMKQDNLLQSHQKRALNSYTVKFLDSDDYWDVSLEDRALAEKNVLKMSNIEELESALVNYLSNNNKTQQLILDSLRQCLIFIQGYEKSTQQQLAIFRTPLQEIKELTEKLSDLLWEAEDRKKSIEDELGFDQNKLISEIESRYIQFEKEFKTLISQIFDRQNLNAEIRGLNKTQIKNLQSAINEVVELGRTTDKDKLSKVLGNYADIANEIISAMYSTFESELKSFCDQKQANILAKVNTHGNMIISRLEQNLNKSLGINNQESSLVTIESIPKIKLPSIRDVVDTEVYDVVREPTGKKSRPSNSDETIFTQFFSVKPELVRSKTEKTINISLSNGKAKAKEIVENRIAFISMQKSNQIKEAINSTRKHLNEKIQERKELGENILFEIEQIESDLDLTRQMITSLTELFRFAENFQSN